MMSNYYDDMKNLIRCAMAVVAGLAISGMLAPVNAEPAAGEGDMAVPKAAIPDEIMKEAQQLQQEIMELQKKLDTIQQAAIAGHPELQKEQKDFMDLLVATMQQQGKDPAKDLAQLRDMQARQGRARQDPHRRLVAHDRQPDRQGKDGVSEPETTGRAQPDHQGAFQARGQTARLFCR